MTLRPGGAAVGEEAGRIVRYVVAGAVNTLATYGLFLLLLNVLDYAWAYTVVFAAGIALGYALQSSAVFRVSAGWTGFVLVACCYLIQYSVGLGVLALLSGAFGVDPRIAALFSIALTVPMGYLISRWIFLRARNGKALHDPRA